MRLPLPALVLRITATCADAKAAARARTSGSAALRALRACPRLAELRGRRHGRLARVVLQLGAPAMTGGACSALEGRRMMVAKARDGWGGWICARGGSSGSGGDDGMAFSGSGGERCGAEPGLGTGGRSRGCTGSQRREAGFGAADSRTWRTPEGSLRHLYSIILRPTNFRQLACQTAAASLFTSPSPSPSSTIALAACAATVALWAAMIVSMQTSATSGPLLVEHAKGAAMAGSSKPPARSSRGQDR